MTVVAVAADSPLCDEADASGASLVEGEEEDTSTDDDDSDDTSEALALFPAAAVLPPGAVELSFLVSDTAAGSYGAHEPRPAERV